MKRKPLKIGIVLLYSLLIFAVPVVFSYALDFRNGSEIILNSGEEIQNNVYVVGGSVKISDKVASDLIIAGGDVGVESEVIGDILIVGGNVSLTGLGKMGEDLRIVAGTSRIDGEIAGESLVIGGDITVSDRAVLKGESLIVGGAVNFAGQSEGKVKIVASEVWLDGSFDNDFEITTQMLVLKEGTTLNGALNYFSPNKLIEENGTSINGQVNYNQIKSIKENGLVKQTILNLINFWLVLRFITTLLLAFILVYVFKVFSQKTTEFALSSFFKSLLFGFLIVFVTPIIGIVLFIGLVTIPIAILLGLIYIFFMIIAGAISGIVVGSLVRKVVKKEEHVEVSFRTASIGVILLTLIQFVPYIGEITGIVFFLVALGAIGNYIYKSIRWRGDF